MLGGSGPGVSPQGVTGDMTFRSRQSRLARALLAALVAAGCASSPPREGPRESPADILARIAQLPVASAIVVDAIAVDRKGAPVVDMTSADFDVVREDSRALSMAVGRLYRGPGSADMADQQDPASLDELAPRAEPSRIVVIVIDQGSLLPGDERRARLVAENCIALLGLSDRVAVIALAGSEDIETMASDRAAIRQTLARLRGLRALNPDSPLPRPPEATRGADIPDRPADTSSGDPPRVADAPPRTSPKPDAIPTLDSMRPERPTASREVLSPAASLAHATSTLKGLLELCDSLRSVPGSKTVLLLSAGLMTEGAEAEATRVIESAARSFVRVYALQIPTPTPEFAEQGRGALRALAEQTGGALVPLTTKGEEALQRMVSEQSLSYLLTLVPAAGESLPNPLRLRVTSRRKNVTVRATRIAVPGRYASLLADGERQPVRRAPVMPPIERRPVAGPSPGRSPVSPELAPMLARASEYAANYSRELSAVVSEEVYLQEWRNPEGQRVDRRLVSDYLMVRIEGFEGWLPFRDVFEVDGQKVRDRGDRLMKLFIDAAPNKAVENANVIWAESARYNLGGIRRTINVPVLPLMFLTPGNMRRFLFSKAGEEKVGGVTVWEVAFIESVRPTIIKTPEGVDVQASGRFWIEPASGRIVRTRLQASTADITVSYGPREELPGLWVPVMMQETYRHPTGNISATATYSKFRRFQVFTQEQVKIPKRP